MKLGLLERGAATFEHRARILDQRPARRQPDRRVLALRAVDELLAFGALKRGDGEAEGVCGIVGEKALLKLEQVWSHGSASGAQAATAPVLSLVSGGGGSTSSSFGLDVLAMVTQPCLHAPACTRARTPTIGTA